MNARLDPWRDRSAPALGLTVVVISDALPERNGVGTYYHDLVHALQGRVFHAELICPDPAGAWAGGLSFRMPGDPTQVICVPPRRRLRARLAALRPDVVVLPTPGPFGFAGLKEARRLGARVIAGYHTDLEQLAGLYWTRPASRLFGRASQRVLQGRSRRIFAASAAAVANSIPMALSARRFGAGRTSVVGTPVDARFLSAAPPPAGETVGRVLFAGRLAPEKNVEAVLEAAARLPEIAFRIAGDGPLSGAVSAAAARMPNLEWLGWRSRGELPALMDAADVVVLPSRVEAFGTVALEAMARARVVVVSRACGIVDWERLVPGLFPMGQGESLAAALGRLGRMAPALRQAQARRAREAVLALADSVAADWANLLADVSRG